MQRKQQSSASEGASVSINIASMLSNALLQPLTQQKMKSNLTFSQNNSVPYEHPDDALRRDPREQYYYEEEYDDEVIDLENRRQADPPIRKIRAVQSAGGTSQDEEDEDYNNKWVIPENTRNNGAAKRRHPSSGMAFSAGLEATPEVREDGDELQEYESDGPEISREQFSEAILHEWRERTQEIEKQNEEMDKDEYTRYEHPSISNYAKVAAAERSLASERSFATESRTQSSSLNAIRKRFAADDEMDFDFNQNSSPRASKQLLEQLRPFKAKYHHLFEDDVALGAISKVEIEYTLRKQLQGRRTSDLRAGASPEGSPFPGGKDEAGLLRRDSLGIASDAGAGKDGETPTPLLLDKLTSRLSHYSQLNQLLNKTLKHRCHEQSHQFDVGMNKITNVLVGMREVKDTTNQQRDQLKKFREEMAGQILRVSLLRVKQQRLREIQQVMQHVIGKYNTQVLQQVYEMINSGEFIDALALIRKAQTEIYADFRQAMPHLDKSQFHDVKILDMIITRMGQAEECIWKILGHSLQNFCLGHPFSSEQYGQVFHCYSEYSQLCLNARQPGSGAKKGSMEDAGLKLYCNMILQKFEEGLDRAVQVLANSIILGDHPVNPYRERSSLHNGSDQRRQTAEDLIYAVRDCYIALCRVLYNHHMIVRWHHNAEMDPQQKQWLTNQLLHVQRPALVAQIDGLVTVNIISPLRSKICSRDPGSVGGGKDGLMALPKLTQFLTLTGLLANILGETSHQKKGLKLLETTNNQIVRVYAERAEKDMMEDFREVLECVEAFERMPVQEGFDIWGKERDDPMAGNARPDLLEVFKGQSGAEPGKMDQSSYLAQFVHRNPFLEVLPNPKIQGQAQSGKQQARSCLAKLQQLLKPQTTLEAIHDEYPFLKLGIAQLNSQNLMKLDQLQNQNANFYNIDEDEYDNSEDDSNDSDCINSSDSGEEQGIQMMQRSASSRPSAPYQSLSRVFSNDKKSKSEAKDLSSDELVMSISGLSLVRTVLYKHLSMMRALRGHTFEVFVSFTQCVRFYGHVVCSVFIHKDTYHQLINDVILYGAAYSQQAKTMGLFNITDRERSRVCKLVHFQARYENVKKLIVDGQTWVEGLNQNDEFSKNQRRDSNKFREEMNVQNLHKALGANSEACTLATIQGQYNNLFSRFGESSSDVNKIQLFLKQLVALHQLQLIQKVLNSPMPSANYNTQQSQIFGSNVADSTGGTNQTIKEVVKGLLAPNVQQISYMLDFFDTQNLLNESLKELITRQGLKMLLAGSQPKDSNDDVKQRKTIDPDKALEEQFALIGQTIQHIVGNVPHSHKWSGVERRTEPSGYINKLLEQIKQFEYKLQRLCAAYHLSQTQIMTDQLWWLWDMLASDLIEQYSLVTDIDATGRQNMISDVEYLMKLCHNIFRACQIHPMHLLETPKRSKEPLHVPPSMLALRDYLQAYFHDLGQLLQFSKKYIQTAVTFEQLKRLYKVHPALQADARPQPQAKTSFFKKLTKSSSEVQPKDVQDFFANVDIFNDYFFSKGIRQEDLSEHPGASGTGTVLVSGLLS